MSKRFLGPPATSVQRRAGIVLTTLFGGATILWAATAFWAASALLPTPAYAAVTAIEIERREPLLSGQSFGERGAYELIQGRVRFGFDPNASANERISDLALAPRDAAGQVVAEGDFLVLQAIDPTKRSGTALIDVPNRGRRLALSTLNLVRKSFTAPATLDPNAPADWGDGFMMEQGLTIIWVGWQADAPRFPGSMSLDVPRATQADGSPLYGPARSDWVVDQPTERLRLGVLGHTPHRVSQRGAQAGMLTRRRHRESEREIVPRDAWRFEADGASIERDGEEKGEDGFDAGWLYELVYESKNPPLVGLGFAAYRDFASYALYDPESPFPVKRTVALGASQSGRFLRHFLYEGFTQDEEGRPILDGVVIQIGGSGRGGFNHRFSHPGRVGNPYANFFYPGDEVPFTSRPSKRKAGLSFRKAGLLDRLAKSPAPLPLIFQINTGYEYWGRAASLVHMTVDGKRDVAPLTNERLYHIASAPHYPLAFPPEAEAETGPGIYRGSALDTSPAHRALLLHMLDWLESDVSPPPSNQPTIRGGSLVPPESLRYPLTPMAVPRSPHVAYPLDFGPDWQRGIISHQPPRRGKAYAIRVPAIDGLGNEATGIRSMELRVPIGTYTPWALRTGFPTATDEMVGYLGSFMPFAQSAAARRPGDERPTLHELYPTRAAYDRLVAEAADALIAAGWMLERDRARSIAAAAERWIWITRNEP